MSGQASRGQDIGKPHAGVNQIRSTHCMALEFAAQIERAGCERLFELHRDAHREVPDDASRRAADCNA